MTYASLAEIPYVEAANWSRSAGPQHKLWIVIHCMQYPEKPDSAEWCANYLHTLPPTEQKSAHACIDSNSIVQCVPWERIAWHAPGANKNGIGLEHAGWSKQAAAEWSDPYSRDMLELSAWLCAQLCKRFGIPPKFRTAPDLRSGIPGITTHAEVTSAWPDKSHGHTDPGPGFPIEAYCARVRQLST